MRLPLLLALAGSLAALSACTPGIEEDDEERGSTRSSMGPSDVASPAEDPEERKEILAEYASITRPADAPSDLLDDALLFFHANKARLDNQRYVTVVDFSRHSSKKRFFMIDMQRGVVESHVVAHGSGSDGGNTGFVKTFSNVPGSNASSEGFYVTAETYDSAKNGLSLRLDGVSRTNSNARRRLVVIHGANYVDEGRSKQGRSWGCPALPHEVTSEVISAIKGGSVLYIAKSNVSAKVEPKPDAKIESTPDLPLVDAKPSRPEPTPEVIPVQPEPVKPVEPVEPAPEVSPEVEAPAAAAPEADGFDDDADDGVPAADARTRQEREADETEPESDPEVDPTPLYTMSAAGCSAAARGGEAPYAALAIVAGVVLARRRPRRAARG